MRAGSSAVVHMASVKWDSADKKNQKQSGTRDVLRAWDWIY